jgi:hypothetical protein
VAVLDQPSKHKIESFDKKLDRVQGFRDQNPLPELVQAYLGPVCKFISEAILTIWDEFLKGGGARALVSVLPFHPSLSHIGLSGSSLLFGKPRRLMVLKTSERGLLQ